MNSYIKDPDPTKYNEIKYPWLGRNHKDGHIVLFTGPGSGVVVGEGWIKSYKVGADYREWNEQEYSHFHGEIILRN